MTASFNFLTNITRDDLRYAEGKQMKYNADPGNVHFNDLGHQCRFLKGTLDYGVEALWFATDSPNNGHMKIEAWSDSSFADDIDTGRTTIGNVIKIDGTTVSASSKLSARVDSCVNHSELNAFSDLASDTERAHTDSTMFSFMKTSRDLVYIRGVVAALEGTDERNMPPTKVFVDNTGVISMLGDPNIKAANRHSFRTLEEVRERVHLDKTIWPVKVHTKANLANAMTKQEPGQKESAAMLLKICGPRTPYSLFRAN